VYPQLQCCAHNQSRRQDVESEPTLRISDLLTHPILPSVINYTRRSILERRTLVQREPSKPLLHLQSCRDTCKVVCPHKNVLETPSAPPAPSNIPGRTQKFRESLAKPPTRSLPAQVATQTRYMLFSMPLATTSRTT